MTDDFEFLRSLRPDPQPDAGVTERHRAQLSRVLSGEADAPASVEPAAVTADDPYGPVRPGSARTSRRWAAALVGAAAMVLSGLGVWAVAGDDGSSVATGTTGNGPTDANWPPSTSDAAAPAPTVPICGSAIPASLEVPGALSGPLAVPVAEAEPAALPGQVVLRWTRPEGSVEVRWPAAPPPDYDLDESRPRSEPSKGLDGSRMELWVDYEDDGSGTNPPADLIVNTAGQEPPAEGCTTMEVRASDGDGTIRTGVNLTDLGDWVELGALVIDREEVETAPRDAVKCSASEGEPPPPNRKGGGTTDPQPTPTGALRQFLATPAADGLGDSWFTELLEADGTITYGTPSDGGEGYVVLISVVPDDGGWVVEGWKSSGC